MLSNGHCVCNATTSPCAASKVGKSLIAKASMVRSDTSRLYNASGWLGTGMYVVYCQLQVQRWQDRTGGDSYLKYTSARALSAQGFGRRCISFWTRQRHELCFGPAPRSRLHMNADFADSTSCMCIFSSIGSDLNCVILPDCTAKDGRGVAVPDCRAQQ